MWDKTDQNSSRHGQTQRGDVPESNGDGAAAGPGRLRLGEAERQLRDDHRVGRAAAVGEDVAGEFGGLRVGGGDHDRAAVAERRGAGAEIGGAGFAAGGATAHDRQSVAAGDQQQNGAAERRDASTVPHMVPR